MAKKSWHQKFRRASRLERTDTDGQVFDSVSELRRWKLLQRWQLAGEIRGLRRQVSYPLILPPERTGGDHRPILTPSGKTATWTADFVYDRHINANTPEYFKEKYGVEDFWEEVIEDTKGYQSRENQFRIAVFEAIYGKKVTISRDVRK